MILRLFKDMVFKLRTRKTKICIQRDLINQFGSNTCHHNNKLDKILSHLHLF